MAVAALRCRLSPLHPNTQLQTAMTAGCYSFLTPAPSVISLGREMVAHASLPTSQEMALVIY